MKKIFLLLVVVGMLTTACKTGVNEDDNTPPNEQQSDGNNEDSNEDSNEDNLSSIECARNEIIYKTKYGYPVTLYKETGFGGILVSNTYENSIGRLIFDADITDIPDSSFKGCTSIIEIKFPDSFTEIGGYAFYGCTSLTSITIPDSVTEIGGYAFYGCTSLTSITIPNSVTSIGSCAFYGCTSLTSVAIPDSVTEIGISAFENCSSLTSVTIGKGVTSIKEKAFSGCSSLTSVYCKPTTPPGIHYYRWSYLNDDEVGSFPFYSGMTIYVPRSAYNTYMSMQWDSFYNNHVAKTNWYEYKSYIEPYDF